MQLFVLLNPKNKIMSRKTILPTTAIFCLLLHSFNSYSQLKRETKGRLLLMEGTHRQSATQERISNDGRHARFRSFDGRNNNVGSNRGDWGAADINLFREMPADYASADPNNAMNGTKRPSPREISNLIIDEPVTVFNTRDLSTLVYQWGQFLDHEMTLTPTDTIEYVPIPLPANEVIFTEAIPFYRSEFRRNRDFQPSVRQQINLNTSFIDGSVVYGSDAQRAKWLRTFKNGKLKTSKDNLMPFNTISGEFADAIDPNAPEMANDGGGTIKTFVAGDVRASENPVLISIHTLFVREHNRICDRLLKEGMNNDELIYQMARKEIGALIQVITYKEFLPALGITLRPYAGYRSDTRPDITNTFATAAYRLGHTMVSDDVLLIDNNCKEVGPGEMELVDVFWNPQLVLDNNIDIFLKGASSHDQYQTDTKINNVLRNFLFVSPNDPVRFGIDLGSLNIQRGRDHGLPDYNTARRFYTGRAARKFIDITTNDTLAENLRSLYAGINNVDLWIGLLAEDHLPNSSVGNTLHEMLRAQFEKLRDGDYYFYLNDPFLPDNVRRQVANTSFAALIKRNTTLTNLTNDVFHTEECEEDEETANKTQPLITKLGIPSSNEKTWPSIYPNPATDNLTVTLDGKNVSTVKVFSANGELSSTIISAPNQKSMQINIRNLSKGYYVISVTTANGTKSFTFIKQ
jgi:peroxidase